MIGCKIAFETVPSGNSFLIHGLSCRHMYAHCLRAFLRLASHVSAEVDLDTDPISPSTRSIEQNQDNRHLLPHPQIEIANVQIEYVIGTHSLQRFGCFELNIDRTRLEV